LVLVVPVLLLVAVEVLLVLTLHGLHTTVDAVVTQAVLDLQALVELVELHQL
jgi:hypothetical protein